MGEHELRAGFAAILRSRIGSEAWRGLALGGISGALCVACVTPHHRWYLGPVVLTPYAMAVISGSKARVVGAGAGFGLVVSTGCLGFVLPSLHAMASFSWPMAILIWLAIAVNHALRPVAAGMLARALWLRGRCLPLVLPAAWVLAEWAVPVLFPWPVGIVVEGHLPWLQLAEVGGPLMLSWWVVAAAAGIGSAITGMRSSRAWAGRRDDREAASGTRGQAGRATTWARSAGEAGPIDVRSSRPSNHGARGGWIVAGSLLFSGMVVTGASVFGLLLQARAEERLMAAPSVTIGVVQGANPPAVANNEEDPLQHYRRESLALVAVHPDIALMVWPEAISVAPVLETDLRQYLRDYVRTDRRDGEDSVVFDKPLLVGLNIYEPPSTRPPVRPTSPSPRARPTSAAVSQRSSPGRAIEHERQAPIQNETSQQSPLTNSMILFDGQDVVGRYDKQILMPMGEAAVGIPLPGIGTWELIAPVTRYRPGTSHSSMRLHNHGLSTVVCYEDLVPSHVRRLVHEGGSELLVSASSDGWFEGDHARRLHFMLASLRSIETRRYLLRATRDGMSGMVGPTGRTEWSLPNQVVASGTVSARWMSGATAYVRFGDWPMLIFAGFSCLWAWGRGTAFGELCQAVRRRASRSP